MTTSTRIIALTVSAALAFGVPAFAADEGSMGDHKMDAAAAAEAPMVKGEVTKIDERADKVTIKHDAIPNLDMEAMTMVFKAGDGVAVKDVKPGDKIKFQAEKVNGQLTVTKVEKAK